MIIRKMMVLILICFDIVKSILVYSMNDYMAAAEIIMRQLF